MINTVWGIAKAPFQRDTLTLLPQQQQMMEMIHIHAQQGGFCVIVGEPGVGKTVLREHIEQLNQQREFCVVSCSRTLHTYRQVLWQLAESFKLETTEKRLEVDLIDNAFTQSESVKPCIFSLTRRIYWRPRYCANCVYCSRSFPNAIPSCSWGSRN